MRSNLVTEYLDETAARLPDKMAFVDEVRGITFAELRREARQVASGLARRGLYKSPVAIYIPKSASCIGAFLGAAYSGNFYTPLDTDMPAARVEKILQTLQPSAIVTDRAHLSVASQFSCDISVLAYEDLQEELMDEEKLAAAEARCIDTDVLYVMFTSGSTGVPKGVTVSHKAVVSYVDWAGGETFGIDERDVLANQTPIYFSMSVFDVYVTLKTGCTTFFVPKVLFSFPIKLLEYLAEHRVTVIYWVPSALCLAVSLKALGKRDISCLQKILFAGEPMPTKQLNKWRLELPHALFANLFGPTEVTDICNYYVLDRQLDDAEPVPIGNSCEHLDTFILDEENHLSESGELCIRGTSLAYGYYNNSEKTEEVFVQNPLQHAYPEIIYRTGDLVRRNERGELVYMGRKDFQIKHMGHRIELGEIETAAISVPGVNRACVLYDEIRQRIVLFYEGAIEEHEIGEALKGIVPEYMLPAKRKKLMCMPLNLNGKIDRAGLRKEL